LPSELADLLQRGDDILIGYLYLIGDRLACAGYVAHPFVKWMVLLLISSFVLQLWFSQMKECKSISRIY
jgi:hypothetical protein